jgi:hypothetical protein
MYRTASNYCPFELNDDGGWSGGVLKMLVDVLFYQPILFGAIFLFSDVRYTSRFC